MNVQELKVYILLRNNEHYVALSYKAVDTLSCVIRKHYFAYAKTKAQIICTGVAQLISIFVFAIWIQILFYTSFLL